MNTTNQTTSLKQEIRPMPIMIALILGAFIGLFGETALNLALSDIMNQFGVSPSQVQWLMTGYLLVLGVLVPVSALLIQWFTTRQLFIASLLFSIAGTLMAALAPNFAVLLFARVIHAVGTGLLLPLMSNVLLIIYPPQKRGMIMGMLGLVLMFAPSIGPTVSGIITESLGWQWIFWICLPLLIFSLAFGYSFMQNVTQISKPKVDVLSIVLSTIGFGAIVYGFSSAGEGSGGWTSPSVLIMILIGLISLVLFGIRQSKMEQPMISLRVFKYPMFSLGLLLVFVAMVLNLSSAILLPMYLQGGILLTASVAGFVLLPGGVINGILLPITGRLFDKYGPKWLVIPGFFIATIALFLFTNITTGTSAITVTILHTMLLIGIVMILMPTQTNSLNQLPRELYPDGNAVMGTLQQVSGAVGSAIAVSIMSAGQKAYLIGESNPSDPVIMSEALTAGVQNAFVFGLVASMIGLVAAFFIKRAKV